MYEISTDTARVGWMSVLKVFFVLPQSGRLVSKYILSVNHSVAFLNISHMNCSK